MEGIILGISTNGKRGNDMKLMEVILRDENLDEAMKRVKSNKGVPGVDKMLVDEIDAYFEINRETIKKQILEKKYKPQPVKRVYIPKPNGKKRPLGYRASMMKHSVTIVLVFVRIEVRRTP